MRDDSSYGKARSVTISQYQPTGLPGAGFADTDVQQAARGHDASIDIVAAPETDWADAMDTNAQTRFVAAIEQTPLVAVQGFTRDGIVSVWNKASEKLYGIAEADAIGRRFTDLLTFHDVGNDFDALLANIWDGREPTLPRDWKITTVSGRQLWVYSTLFPVVENGQTVQIFCMDIDITLRKEHEHHLFESHTKLRELFDNSPDAIILLRDGKFHEFNAAALRLFGYDQHEFVGTVPHQVSPPYQPDGRDSAEKMQEMHAIALANGSHRFEWQYCTRDRQPFWGEVTITAIADDGAPYLYATVRDITSHKQAEQALRLSAQVFEKSHEAILILDPDWRILSVNAAFTGMTGIAAHAAIGAGTRMLQSVLHEQSYYDAIAEELRCHDHWQGEVWLQRYNRQAFPAWASLSAVRNGDNRICNYIAIFADITDRKANEERIRHLSEHDFLTGLPNRVLLLDRLHQAIAAARRNRSRLAVMFLDLDRFKNINDSLGHHIGDKLLQAVAERLKKCVRSNDTVSRQGGDEFVVMLTEIGGVDQVAHVAGNILQTVAMPYQIDEFALSISTCIGISVYPDDGQEIDALVKNADTAMYHAKDNGRNSYQFFSREMNVRIVERLTLENRLRKALEHRQFSLEYLPEVDMQTGRMIGAEALLRWQHPDAGLLTPQHFLPVAEECGLIVPIGDWVLEAACRQARSWHDQGMPVAIAVNLSAIQFRQKDFVSKVRRVLQQTGLAPQFLELEITESVLIDTNSDVLDTMHALREMGVVLAVDDFGTGYSSLSYLKHFPVQKLKIDQSFVQDLSEDANDAAIIRAILIMAKSLNLKVIAEGVETLDQLDFLQSQGCDEYQGHYVTQPISPAELRRFWHVH